MDIEEYCLFGRSNPMLVEDIHIEEDSLLGSKNILPLLEDEMYPSKIGAYGATSTLCLSDNMSEQMVLPPSSEIKFDEEQFFGKPVLNMSGGPGRCLTNEYNGDLIEIKPTFMNYLKPHMDALSGVHDFVEFDAKSNSLSSPIKPIEETDRLVKLKYDQKPFYYSLRDVITQKPLDIQKVTGRMTFELADISLIEKNSKLKMFLRDKATDGGKILDLSGKRVERKHRCNCFDDHDNSLFCIRSPYEEAVQITWSGNKSYVFINVVDDEKFELLFAPLIKQSNLKNHSSIIMQLVFQMESEEKILEQSFYIKFLMSPKRDMDKFIKTLVKEGFVDESYLEEIPDSSVPTFEVLKVQIEAKFEDELKKFLNSIGGEVAFQ